MRARDGPSDDDLYTVDRLEDLPEPAPDADVVVVDVIISSTSIVRLLEAGAAYVRPFGDVDEALAFRERTDGAMLVGEQGGEPIDGFDGSVLPSVFREYDLDGRPVGILTSNGTRAVDRLDRDRGVFAASTVNAAAVASTLRERDRDAWLVAAGRRGSVVPEDLAGVELVERAYRDSLTDDVRTVLAEQIRQCDTAAWLASIGYENELEALLSFDSTDTVPRLRDGVFRKD